MELFGTAGIRGSAENRVTPGLALDVGLAVGHEATAEPVVSDAVETPDTFGGSPDPDVQAGSSVVIARDGRVTGPALQNAVQAGVNAAGATVLDSGSLPTPALAYATRGRYGIMLTASHNPPHDNGIKLFRDGVEFDADREDAIETRVEADPVPAEWSEWATAERIEVLPAYRAAVASYARQFGAPLEGMRIAVDCGNGMASPVTPHVLRELGAAVVTLNANVDGHFPGRGSKPTPETLHDLREFIADANEGVTNPGRSATDDGFAFGIGHDGDADRIVIVDPTGDVVHEDTVLAILAERYTRDSTADDPVVITTPNASGRIDERVQAAGGRVERVRLGALHEGIAAVRQAADGSSDVVFAAEPWKHIHTRFGGWIDGVCSAAVFARLVADDGLDGLRAPVTERPYRKVSIDCADAKKDATMDRLESTLPTAFDDVTVSTEHGVRLSFPDASWLLVRPSGTEPYVRLYAESDEVDAVVDRARDVIESAVDAA